MSMASLAGVASKSALVVKEMNVNENGPHYVHIVAGQGGSTTVFDVYEDRVECVEGSLFGRMTACIPASAVSAIIGGIVRPILMLIIGVVLLAISCVGGFMGTGDANGIFGIIGAIIGILMIVGYYRSKSLIISVDSNGSRSFALCLKRSAQINAETAYKIVQIIKERTLAQTSIAASINP